MNTNFDLLTLTQMAERVGISQSMARRLVKKGTWRPDATAANGFLFLPSRAAELKRLIHTPPTPRNLIHVEPEPML